MFGFIRSISFTVQAMIPVLGMMLFAIALYFPGNMQPAAMIGNGFYYLPKDGWLYTTWMEMARLPLWMQVVPSCLVAIFTAWRLILNDMNNVLMGRRSYSIGFVFLFLLTSGGHFFIFHPAFLAGLMMVLSQRFLLGLYKRETEYSLVFAMGFTWGVAMLLYPPVTLLTPALLLGLLLMVTTNWRHWLVSLLGIAIPIALAGTCWFLLGDLKFEIECFFSWFKIRHSFIPGFITREPFIAAWLALILIWIIIASARYRNPRIQSRQLFQANFLLFLFTLLITVFLETVSVEFIWLLVIPVSYLTTFWALEVRKGWLRDLFFISLLLIYAFFRIRGTVL